MRGLVPPGWLALTSILVLSTAALSGCWNEAGSAVAVGVDNESSSSVVLVFGTASYTVDAGSKVQVSDQTVASSAPVLIRALDCRLLAKWTMPLPGFWLITVKPDGAPVLTSTNYPQELSSTPPVLSFLCVTGDASPSD